MSTSDQIVGNLTEKIVDLLDTPLNEPTRGELSIQINTLQREIERLQTNCEAFRRRAEELNIKIGNAAGVIRDYISENGDITDELRDIATYLGVELTKEISGTATFEISFTARIPLDMDPSDFEISFDVNNETYQAEDFDWDEENTEVNAEEV
jgi:hypothetical protein